MADGNEELTGLDEKNNEPVTETLEQKAERLEVENKGLKDGSSRLGREFKSYKEEQSGKYDEILERMSKLATTPQKPVAVADEYEDEEEKRLRRIAREEAKLDREATDSQRVIASEQYVKDYTKAIQRMGKAEDPEDYEAIAKEMENMPGYSNNGAADAERNYEKGERNYYKNLTKKDEGTHAFKGQDPTGTKAGGSSTVTSKDTTDGDVGKAMADPVVQAYLNRRHSGKTEEEKMDFVKKAIAGKTQLSGKIKI